MSTKENTPEELDAPEQVPEKPKKTAKAESEMLLLNQYFERHAPEVHPYTRAFVSVNYYGILKTKEEWEQELSGKI